MGDDVMAPNAGTLEIAATASVEDLLSRLLGSHYLASVAGGATWSVWSGKRLLGVLRESDLDSFHFPTQIVLAPESAELRAQDVNPLFCRYHCAAGPAEVLRNPDLRR
jgi:hypothetical protein